MGATVTGMALLTVTLDVETATAYASTSLDPLVAIRPGLQYESTVVLACRYALVDAGLSWPAPTPADPEEGPDAEGLVAWARLAMSAAAVVDEALGFAEGLPGGESVILIPDAKVGDLVARLLQESGRIAATRRRPAPAQPRAMAQLANGHMVSVAGPLPLRGIGRGVRIHDQLIEPTWTDGQDEMCPRSEDGCSERHCDHVSIFGGGCCWCGTP